MTDHPPEPDLPSHPSIDQHNTGSMEGGMQGITGSHNSQHYTDHRQWHYTVPAERQKPRPRDEKQLLEAVQKEVHSRLKQSLHNAVLITLRKEAQPQQVQRLSSIEVKIGDRPPEPLPDDRSIAQVFTQDDVGEQLLILGHPGAGKTTTMLELAKALVERAESDRDAPIPVLVNLSSWKDDRLSIADWLVAELRLKYGVSPKLGSRWTERRQLLPLLDGLDELEPHRQEPCVVAINHWLRSEQRPPALVVCSRLEEYSTYDTKLLLEGAICLQPLSDIQIENYLTRIGVADLWLMIQSDQTLLDLIRTPLLLSVMVLSRTKRNPEHWQPQTPAEQHRTDLLDVYVQQMLDRKLKMDFYGKKLAPSAAQTRYWLIWIAQQLEKDNETEFLIERLNPSNLSHLNSSYDSTLELLAGLVVLLPITAIIWMSLSFAVLILWSTIKLTPFLFHESFNVDTFILMIFRSFFSLKGWDVLIILGLLLTFSFNYSYSLARYFFKARWTVERLREVKPIDSLKWSWKSAFRGTRAGKFIYVPFSKGHLALIVSIAGFLSNGWVPKYNIDPNTFKFANSLIFQSLLNCIKISFSTSATIIAIMLLPILFSDISLIVLLEAILYTMFIALLISPLISIFNESGLLCLQHITIRWLLFQEKLIPWNYARFLDYCTERLLLQRVGGRYRFVHKVLQEHFAAMPLQQERR